MSTKLNRLSKVRPCQGADSVRASKRECTPTRRAMDVLMEAQAYWTAMETYRETRRRNKRFTFGQQWDDKVCYNNQVMTEEDYLRKQGNFPLQNNLILRLVRNVIGVWRNQNTEPTCVARDRDEQKLGETMSTLLQYNMGMNRMTELYARSMMEFLISAFVVHKKWYGWRKDSNDCWTDMVQPDCFFIDTNMRDVRGWDASCMGEIHDVDFNTLCSRFAHSPADYQRLSDIYRVARDTEGMAMAWSQWGVSEDNYNTNFLVPNDHSRCRVIEVWRKERKPRYRCHDYNSGEMYKIEEKDFDRMVRQENQRRLQQAMDAGIPPDDVPMIEAEWMMDSYWYYYYLSPLGDILQEGETPYDHKEHPYSFLAYPYIDGETHSFVADVIDQQKYVNRLVTMHDWIMRSSAKGVLLVPAECIPNNMSIEEFAESWSSVNGVVLYTPSKTGHVPQQVASNSTNIGISEMLQVQLKFFEDISGVHGALQGKTATSGTSGTLYAQQTQNSTTSLLDMLDSFEAFVRDAAYKDIKNIQQFYDDRKVISIAGRNGRIAPDPDKIRDAEFDLNIVPSTQTPVHRAMANEFLMQIWQSGQINLEQLLKTGSFPFGDELLQSIKTQQEEMQNGQTPQGLPPQLMQQAQSQGNPQAARQLASALAQ